MKKWQKCYIGIMGILFVIDTFAAIWFVFYKDCLPRVQAQNMWQAIILFSFLIIIAGFVWIFILIGSILKQGIHNTRDCDDETFRKIDKYKNCWDEDKDCINRQIRIINLYYRDGGEVDRLVEDKELNRLYARKDFLIKQNDLYGELLKQCIPIPMSVGATYIYDTTKNESIELMSFCLLAIVFIAFMPVLLKYAERGQAGSYRCYVNEYESKLLAKKIKKLEKRLTMTKAEEPIQKDKQDVIDQLIKLRKKTRKKSKKKQKEKPTQEDLEQMIAEVSKLDLQVVELNFQNPAYEKYCKIVNDYNLCSKFAKVDPDNPRTPKK